MLGDRGQGSSVFLSKCEVKGTSVVFCLPSMDAFFYCHIIATGSSTLWWFSNILARLGAGLSLWSSLKVLNEEICVKGQGNVSLHGITVESCLGFSGLLLFIRWLVSESRSTFASWKWSLSVLLLCVVSLQPLLTFILVWCLIWCPFVFSGLDKSYDLICYNCLSIQQSTLYKISENLSLNERGAS